jgi:hypothetical protein
MFFFDLYVVCIFLACLVPSAWSLPRLGVHHQRPHFAQRNLETVRAIYNLTVFPNQLPILGAGAAGVPPGLFNANATGRVDPVGNFSGFEDSIEYFFALAPVPLAPTFTAISRIEITEFSSACEDVAASVVYLFCHVDNPGSPDHGKELAPLKQVSDATAFKKCQVSLFNASQVAFWKFDDCGAVLKYDAWIPNLNSWVMAALGIPIGNPDAAAQSIQQICGATQQRCLGPNAQWSSIEECIFTLSQKAYGNYDEAWGDNIVCRSIHLVLTKVRPDVSPFSSSSSLVT